MFKDEKSLLGHIAKYIKDPTTLATHVGLPEHICNNIILDNSSNEERCYQVLKEAHNSSENGKLCCWKSVYPYLNKFENGREVIAILKRQFAADGGDELLAHENNIENTFIVGHHYQIDKTFRLESSNCQSRVPVDISSRDVPLKYNVTHKEWSENKEDYCLKHKDLISTTNCLNNSNDECDIMRVLKSAKGDFFVMKHVDHCRIRYQFHSKGELKGHCPQIDFLHRFKDVNIFLHISLANNNNIREVLNGNLEAILLIQSTYECLRNNCIHVSVVAYDETLSEIQVNDICEVCSFFQLIVPKKILENPETFNNWFSEAVINNKYILRWKELFYKQGHEPIIAKFKHELFPRIALYDDKVPNFVLTIKNDKSYI